MPKYSSALQVMIKKVITLTKKPRKGFLVFSFLFFHSTILLSMNRKFLASLALFLVLFTGAFSPVASLVSQDAGPQIAYAQATGTTETQAVTKSSVDEITCGINVLCAIVTGYAGFIQFLPHLLAQVSGMLLDYVVWKNLESSTWTSQDTVDSFVVKGWKLVRDFSNLLFIFALFAVGFSLILNGAETGFFDLNPKRTIARVILMALLINFSFFMCRFIIEVTNLGANVFYNAVTKVETPPLTQATQSSGNGINLGSSDAFYSQFDGIRSISLGVLSITNAQQLILNAGSITGTKEDISVLGYEVTSWYEYDWGVYILILFVSTITGVFNFFLVYLFLSSSIFLFARIYGLYFLIILSPIAFVSTTIPALQSKEYFGFDDWFKQLVGLAFSLPIYMFFVYLAIFFLKVGENVASDGGYVTMAVVILTKLISAGFVLVMGKKVSKDLSGKIGAMASGAVNGIITGTAMVAGAAMTGGASAALRMSGNLARNAAVNTASRVGEVVAGKDNVEAIRQRFSSGNFKSFSRFNNFNPMRGMRDQNTLSGGMQQLGRNFGASLSEAARMSGSELPDKTAAAFRAGKLTPRAESMARAREEREKKIKDIEFKNGLLNQQLKNPNLTKTEKEALRQQIKDNNGQIWNLNNPTPTAQTGQQAPQQPPIPPANPPVPVAPTAPQNAPAGAQSQSGAQSSGGGNNIPKPPASAPAGDAGGRTTPTSGRGIDTNQINNQPNSSPLTPEQTKQIATEIENDMRSLEKEMNEPANRLNKDRMQELESKYNNLDKERKGLGEGNVLPARLKSFAGQPVGQPSSSSTPKTFGQGNTDRSWKTTLNQTQQERVLNKAIAKEERIAQKAAARAKGASKTQALLSGISGGAAAVAAAPVIEAAASEFDQSELIETPDTMDFGGIQIPEPASNVETVRTVPIAPQPTGAIKPVGSNQRPTTGLVDRFGNPLSSSNNSSQGNNKAA